MSQQIDTARQKHGFLPAGEQTQTIGESNYMLDQSVLISRRAQIGKNNVFYPNVVISVQDDGELIIGDGNTFFPGTFILAQGGRIIIGDGNEFGTGGCTIKANRPDAVVHVGDGGRYTDNPTIVGKTTLGDGSQIIGHILVDSCSLADGESHTSPEVAKRGAVLKGTGLARNLSVNTGEVVNGTGDFSHSPVEQQTAYHPRAPRKER